MYHLPDQQRWNRSPSTWQTSSSNSSVHSISEEPAASKWHTWAKEEDKHSDTPSPRINHNTPTIKPSHVTLQQQQQQYNEMPRKFTLQSHEDPFLLVTSDPPLCFCKKPANRSFTIEYGPILECASYDTNIEEGQEANTTKVDKLRSWKARYTCGFHVHERSWLKLRQAFLKGHAIDPDYSELQSCPLYNFTYCTIFYVTNAFDKVPPLILPKCFCEKPVILRQVNHTYAENRPHYFFRCEHAPIEGHRKCNWKLEANEVAFPRPKTRIHDRVSEEEYRKYFSTPPTQQSQQPQPKSQQHQHDLLATLTGISSSATATTTAPPSLSSQPNASSSNNNNNIIDFESLKEKLSTATTTLVPTSVMGKKQQPSLTRSSSTTTTASSPVITSPVKIDLDAEELKFQNLHLQKTLERVRKESQQRIQSIQNEMEQALDKLTLVEMDCKEELSSMNFDLREEIVLRENCQNKLAHNEIKLANLIMDKDRLAEEYASYREEIKLKYGKEEERNKCKVCFHRAIEYVLIPCYHYAYCHPCAIKLKECAICRRTFTGIQKIYNC